MDTNPCHICHHSLLEKIYVFINFDFKEQDGRSENPFLPFPNFCHPCLLLCKFGLLHLIHLYVCHPCSQQKRTDLSQLPSRFSFILDFHILICTPSSKPTNNYGRWKLWWFKSGKNPSPKSLYINGKINTRMGKKSIKTNV